MTGRNGWDNSCPVSRQPGQRTAKRASEVGSPTARKGLLYAFLVFKRNGFFPLSYFFCGILLDTIQKLIKNQQSTIFPLKGFPEAEVCGGAVVSAESGQNGSSVPHCPPGQAGTGALAHSVWSTRSCSFSREEMINTESQASSFGELSLFKTSKMGWSGSFKYSFICSGMFGGA